MAGTRLQERINQAMTTRLPKWSPTNFYDEGHVVWEKDSLGEIHFYVSLTEHISNDSDRTYTNEELWVHWLTSAAVDSDELSFASLQSKIRHFRGSIDSDSTTYNSFVTYLTNLFAGTLNQVSLDSDITEIDSDHGLLYSRPIFSLQDSETNHMETIMWTNDSEFITWPAVRSVNSASPDAQGNVPLVLTKVLSGTRDDRPATETDGAIFIVRGDSDADLEGFSYVFDGSQWKFFVYPDRDKNDTKYLKVTGGELSGPLVLNQSFTDNLHAVTKKYVLANVKDTKQSAFLFADSDAEIDLSLLDSENFVITRKQPMLRFYDKINTYVVGGYSDNQDLLKPITASVVGNDVYVTVQNFSPAITGKLELFRDGIAQPFTTDANTVTATNSAGVATGVTIADYNNQQMILTLSIPYDVSYKYELVYTSAWGDRETLIKSSGSSEWIANLESFDFGTY